MTSIMTPKHPRWNSFIELMRGPEGLRSTPDLWAAFTHVCDNTITRPLARNILLKHFAGVDVEESLLFFADYGGFCDCEIVWNVEAGVKRDPKGKRRGWAKDHL